MRESLPDQQPIERLPWHQQEHESLLWFRRFERYRLMEPVRSVAAVFREEIGDIERTEPPGRWYDETKKWKWEERAAAWDAHLVELEEKVIAQEREKVLRNGYALMHKRVETLNKLAEKLVAWTDEEDKVWLPDVKAIGTGPDAERVDLVQFNAQLFLLIERYFKGIAEELGERVKKKDITVTELPANVYLMDPDQDGVEP